MKFINGAKKALDESNWSIDLNGKRTYKYR